MELKRNDVYGLILVAVTVGLLALHGSERHDPHRSASAAPLADTVPLEGILQAGAGTAGTVVFYGVNVVEDGRDEPHADQVVVVVDGRVTAVGPVGSVEAPRGATVIHGKGSDFLVPATRLLSGKAAGVDPTRRLVPGAETDMALLSTDPRRTTRGVAAEGLLLDGVWFVVPPVRHPSGARPAEATPAASGGAEAPLRPTAGG